MWMLIFCRSPAKQLKTSDQLSFWEEIWVGIFNNPKRIAYSGA